MFAPFFRRLVNVYWPLLLIGWVLLAAGLHQLAPRWEDVALDGDLDHLPSESLSLQASRLLREAFPDEQAKSQAVLIFERGGEKLTVEDRQYALNLARNIEAQGRRVDEGPPVDQATPTAEADQSAGLKPDQYNAADGEEYSDAGEGEGSSAAAPPSAATLAASEPLPLVDVWHAKTEIVSSMLLAPDKRAELVVVRLTNDLMAFGNIGVRERLLALIAAEPGRPDGLRVGLTGSAIIGGDMRSAVLDSLESTHQATIVLVLACLLVIYRAPLLVLIPLATIGMSMFVAYDAVALLAQHFGPDDYAWSKLRVFTTTKIFVVVILFGAGTDYCLFLIARTEVLGEQRHGVV
ncbi:MAG: MMPL family transporter, partial [Planctomycetota bacterium]